MDGKVSNVGKTPNTPLVRLVKRPQMSARRVWVIRLAALALSLLAGGLLIALLGHNPARVYAEMVKGALGSSNMMQETVKIAVQLLIVGISVSLSFKMRFWNIGGEGQILFGAMAASYFALFFSDVIPQPLLTVVMLLAAALAGGILGLIPAFFKARWGINETLFTLMLNYIATALVKYLQNGPWKAPGSAFPKIAMFPVQARLWTVFGVHWGWIFALVLALFTWVYLRKSKQGYEISVVGESDNTAKYAGMNVRKILLRTLFFSAALAGLAGFFKVAGVDYVLAETTAGGDGFTAITVAYLANLNPIGMILTAVFIAVLSRGADRIQTIYKIPVSAANVLIGLILMFMLGCEFFIRYKLVFRNSKEVAHE